MSPSVSMEGMIVSTAPITCPQCHGSGSERVQVATATLASSEPAYESRYCRSCNGTGTGRTCSDQELKTYAGEPSEAPGDIFELAKSVAQRSTKPRAMVAGRRPIEVSYGFRGKKSRTTWVEGEVPSDYWILLERKAFSTYKGEVRQRGGSEEEEFQYETQFRLGIDGALSKVRRERETVLWSGTFRYDEMPWSGWEPRPMKTLDEFMIDFDIEGWVDRSTSAGLRERTDVVGDMDFHIEYGGVVHIRRIFPKGVGLYNALANLAKTP